MLLELERKTRLVGERDFSSLADIEVRPARPADDEAIAALLGELGYASEPSDVISRLKALEGPDYSVQVAETEGRVIGLLSLHRLFALHITDPVCHLTALVISANCRRSGVGRRLLEAAESWARANGCDRLMLTTANHRHEAHAFYEANGFAHTGRRFVKRL